VQRQARVCHQEQTVEPDGTSRLDKTAFQILQFCQCLEAKLKRVSN
jgi:hypothetical protein